MCGIVALTGHPDAVEKVLTGLSRLEYRGYDSAGIAAQDAAGHITVRKAVGKLQALRDTLADTPLDHSNIEHSTIRTTIGHTRWATHGTPTTANAHPHQGRLGGPQVTVVHNGIIENYKHLREQLEAQGATFHSATDTEVIPFILSQQLVTHTPLEAIRHAAHTFHGNYAIAALVEGMPDTVLATRKGAPLCLGLGEGWYAVASDPLALAGLTTRFIFLEDGDCALLTPTAFTLHNGEGQPVTRPVQVLDLDDDLSGKQGFRHFMLKEIHEQPAVVAKLIETYTTPDGTLALPFNLSNVTGINIVACGTASYAGAIGKYLLEEHVGVPVNVDIASEFRYRNPPLAEGGLFIAVSQSGETADTLAALEHAKAHGQTCLVLTNAPNSSMARAAHHVLPLLAGREIAVASTKAFTAMVLAFTLLALELGTDAPAPHLAELRKLPQLLNNQLAALKPIKNLADTVTDAHSMLFLGRGVLAPLAYEGALKMKEISYIHAEGYASGEMKHGPIALVDATLPVVNLATGADGLFEKTLSNLREVEARHGRVILITDTAGAAQLDDATKRGLTLITVPDAPKLLTPILFTLPLQLLAYFTATAKGTDVDQPRNLAKSVTVE
ncbi:MAG: glutamine--fructose-6-phosphate transaminase (isomerizing) [Pseudomonadaceae bacterium]|nr:glutamine--fructose-6-phosphate transaminase (isomerizing) [Pseudomonadaceae bacterium]